MLSGDREQISLHLPFSSLPLHWCGKVMVHSFHFLGYLEIAGNVRQPISAGFHRSETVSSQITSTPGLTLYWL